jgi:hypothetical protein
LSVHAPDKNAPPGCVSEPTFYFEDRRAGVALKCYLRHQKLPGGSFGSLILRKAALDRHLGGNQINDLLTADLNAFLKRNIRLERVDHVALGNLFSGIKITAKREPRSTLAPSKKTSVREQCKDPDYWAKRAAFLVLRCLAYREEHRFADWDQALWTCKNSPAQIRGYFRELRDGKRNARRGRPRHKSQTRRAITDYRINRCFQPIQLTTATLAV